MHSLHFLKSDVSTTDWGLGLLSPSGVCHGAYYFGDFFFYLFVLSVVSFRINTKLESVYLFASVRARKRTVWPMSYHCWKETQAIFGTDYRTFMTWS